MIQKAVVVFSRFVSFPPFYHVQNFKSFFPVHLLCNIPPNFPAKISDLNFNWELQPCYGAIEERLRPVTLAFFEQGDFNMTEILVQTFETMNYQLKPQICMEPSTLHVGEKFRRNFSEYSLKILWFSTKIEPTNTKNCLQLVDKNANRTPIWHHLSDLTSWPVRFDGRILIDDRTLASQFIGIRRPSCPDSFEIIDDRSSQNRLIQRVTCQRCVTGYF